MPGTVSMIISTVGTGFLNFKIISHKMNFKTIYYKYLSPYHNDKKCRFNFLTIINALNELLCYFKTDMDTERQGFIPTIITRLFSRFPFLAERWAKKFDAVRSDSIPWTPFTKDLSRCKVALVTTAGVHLKSQTPFDMDDEEGDCTFREIPSDVSTGELMITHKYYDHLDADKDINIVFPIERLRGMVDIKEIGSISQRHFGVMGHILGDKVKSLIHIYAPLIAAKLKEDGADIALMTPG